MMRAAQQRDDGAVGKLKALQTKASKRKGLHQNPEWHPQQETKERESSRVYKHKQFRKGLAKS